MRGVDILISVNTGTTAAPTWTVVGGQRGAKLSEKSDTIETTSKDSAGVKNFDYGLYEWSISADGVYINDDKAYEAIRTAMRTKQTVQVKIKEPTGANGSTNVQIGTALVTSSELDAPYDAEVTYSVDLQGSGTLVSSNES